MYFTKSTIFSFGLLATSQLVAGHSAITAATGDQGGAGSAIGVDPATPRDGTRRNPFQQDATRFRGDAAATCGETLGGGDNDIEAGTAAVMQQNGATLPQVSAGGQVMMTLHQVNGDGAGPYTCMIDATGTGTNWQPMQVTQNVDGNARGRNNDQQMQDLPLTAAVPADMQCTGTVAGQSNVCMVRCENPARAGPFGGCVPVQMAGATGAAAGGTAAGGAATGAAPAAAAPAGAAASGTAATAGTAPAAGTGAQAGGAAAGAAPAAAAPAGQAASGQVAGAQAGAAGAGTAATGQTTGATTGTTGAQAGAAGALPAQGQAAAAPAAGTGATAGAAGAATGATTAAAKRSPKMSSDGALVTDDDQEEEIDLLEGEDPTTFKRWVVKNTKA